MTSGLKECRPCMHLHPNQQPCPQTRNIRFLTTAPQVGMHSFEGISLQWPPLLGKAMFFTKSPKILHLRFSLALVHRGRFSVIASLHVCAHQVTSVVSDSATLWTPQTIGFSRQEYWSGLPCLPPDDLPNSGIKPTVLTSPAPAGGSTTISTT